MKLILTRHGETVENKSGILMGWEQGKLSEEGKEQAKLVSDRLKKTKIDIIYTSDLNRCSETAKEIAKYHPKAKFVKEKRLRERNLGVFAGKNIGKNDWDALEGDLLTNRPKDGESFIEVWARLKDFYEDIIEKYNKETILVVGHGGSICLLQGLIYGKDLEYSISKIDKLKNTAITEIELNKDGSYKILLLNSEKHLE